MRSLEVVDETILNIDLITALVKIIISGGEFSASKSSKDYKPKPPISKIDKVEAALMKELGQSPLPPPPPTQPPASDSHGSASKIAQVVSRGATDGAILIFVDGFQAIRDLIDAFTADPVLGTI